MTIFINENGIKRQLTEEEEIAFNTEIEKAKIAKENNKIAEANAETKKASGKQKLLDLGLSEEEVKALIGI